MMDAHDTNQPLNQGELEEEKKTVEVSEAITETPAEDVTAEVQPEAAPKPATKEDVTCRMIVSDCQYPACSHFQHLAQALLAGLVHLP